MAKAKFDFCPNCGDKEKIEPLGEGKIFCPACNMSFASIEGKPKVDSGSKGTLDEILEGQKRISKILEKHDSVLFPKKAETKGEESFFGF